MKHAKKQDTVREKQIKLLKILAVLLVLALAGAAVTIYRDYRARPGFLEKVWISDRGSDYITVEWEKVRNVNKYVVMYDGNTKEVSGRKSSVKIEGLEENRYYEFSVRADSRDREGFDVVTASARTKKGAHITGESRQMKFMDHPADLQQTSETAVTYLPGKGYTVTPEGKIVFTQPGEITVTAESTETEVYASERKEITVTVLDSVSVDTAGAEPHIMYSIGKDNCEIVTEAEGDGLARYPQAFAYNGGDYIATFVKDENQRIITFGSKRKAYKPKKDLGHANGLTIRGGFCYSVRGGGSKQCVIFEPPNSNYETFDLEYGASGIAYDQLTGKLFTSSRSKLVAYDNDLYVVNKVKPITRKSTYYVQDCGAYAGVLMHCVSGADPAGTNYIDFYDMENSKYLGSIECELGEVESLIVDDEGFIELLCIGEEENFIWKTPVNMKELME